MNPAWFAVGAGYVGLGLVAWVLCFEATPLGGWLPFGLIMVAPIIGFLLGFIDGKTDGKSRST